MVRIENEIKVLRLLREEGRCRFRELMVVTGMSPGGVSRMLKKLIAMGYIRRHPVMETFPPSVYYELTERGRLYADAMEIASLAGTIPNEYLERVDEKLREILKEVNQK